MSEERLTHLIYSSAALPGLEASEFKSILEVARRNNAQIGVTGMLLYTSGSFFQVLEGDEAVVKELYAKIAPDPRHENVTSIVCEPIASRTFGDWTMGFAEANADEIERIDGLNDFFQQGNSLNNLQLGRAKKILAAFAQGRWRARISGDTK